VKEWKLYLIKTPDEEVIGIEFNVGNYEQYLAGVIYQQRAKGGESERRLCIEQWVE